MTKKHRVVFLHGMSQGEIDLVLGPCPPDIEVVLVSGKSPEQDQIEAVSHADFLMLFRAKPTAAVLRSGKNVRLLQLLSAGYDEVDSALLSELGIPYANNGGANSYAVADQSVALMLALYRRIALVDRDVRAGKWRAGVNGLNTFELANKLVGVIGFGNIGQKVTKRVQAFDARVQFYDEFYTGGREKELGVERVSLDLLLRTSDIVTLHTPLTDLTRNMLSREALSSMKRSAIIINTCRGQVIDEAALVEALQRGQIAGAGLDTFEREPVDAANPLLRLDNVVLSPHVAGTTADTWSRRGAFAFHNFSRMINGLEPDAAVRFSR
jgi:phosphoglycerate dehydrogenase-like enzyme